LYSDIEVSCHKENEVDVVGRGSKAAGTILRHPEYAIDALSRGIGNASDW